MEYDKITKNLVILSLIQDLIIKYSFFILKQKNFLIMINFEIKKGVRNAFFRDSL